MRKWISVLDDKPRSEGKYVVCDMTRVKLHFANWVYIDFHGYGWQGLPDGFEVTHYCKWNKPLPNSIGGGR